MVRPPQMPAAEALRLPPLPGWARPEASTSAQPPVTDINEAAFRAGAALALLDIRVRANASFARVWRRRLALKAAAASARMARRGEDEASLRDAFFLRHGGEDPGPAGRLLIAWRGLDRSAPLADDSFFHLADTLHLKADDALRAAIAEVQQLAVSAPAAPFAASQAASVVVAARPDAEIAALWLADAVLAARLKWPRPLPLIAGALVPPSLRSGGHRPYPGDPNWTHSGCLAYGHAAAQACDLFAALERSAQKLTAIAQGKFAVEFPAGAERRTDEPLDLFPPANQNRRTAARVVDIAVDERPKHSAGGPGDPDWADRAGMVVQPRAAMEWVQNSHRARIEAAAQPRQTRREDDLAPDDLSKGPEPAAVFKHQAVQRKPLEKDDDRGIDL